jgi:hypothetical protein
VDSLTVKVVFAVMQRQSCITVVWARGSQSGGTSPSSCFTGQPSSNEENNDVEELRAIINRVKDLDAARTFSRARSASTTTAAAPRWFSERDWLLVYESGYAGPIGDRGDLGRGGYRQ